MKKNMGIVDRTIRTVGAIVIGILLINGTISGAWGVVLGIVAAAFLLSSAFARCPLYVPCHISTRGKETPVASKV